MFDGTIPFCNAEIPIGKYTCWMEFLHCPWRNPEHLKRSTWRYILKTWKQSAVANSQQSMKDGRWITGVWDASTFLSRSLRTGCWRPWGQSSGASNDGWDLRWKTCISLAFLHFGPKYDAKVKRKYLQTYRVVNSGHHALVGRIAIPSGRHSDGTSWVSCSEMIYVYGVFFHSYVRIPDFPVFCNSRISIWFLLSSIQIFIKFIYDFPLPFFFEEIMARLWPKPLRWRRRKCQSLEGRDAAELLARDQRNINTKIGG